MSDSGCRPPIPVAAPPAMPKLPAAISAASILAKVLRDREMVAFSQQYPGYGFEKHKGYGTREHQAALRRLGPCALHRRDFGGGAGIVG